MLVFTGVKGTRVAKFEKKPVTLILSAAILNI